MTTTHQRRGGLIAAAALAAVLAGCSTSSTGASSPPATGPAGTSAGTSAGAASGTGGGTPGASASARTGAPAAATITARKFDFGAPLTVPVGTRVVFVNADDSPHNVTDDDGAFTSATVTSASTMFTAPSKPGTYHFHCSVHPNMHGTLTVR